MDGQLGVEGDNSAVPCLMSEFNELAFPKSSTNESEMNSKAPLKVCSVKAGGMMSFAIDNLGALWMWGNCPDQSSDNTEEFSLVSCPTPFPVWDLHGHTVVKVACGNEHVIALVSVGETHEGEDLVCYSWGSNNHGQLGLGDKESRLHPEIIKTFNEDCPWAVYEVACGAFHTALLTRRKRPGDTSESMCWTFGLGDKGQLGHGTTQSTLVPEPVKQLPQPVYLISVDCGLFHTSVVSLAGDVWSWGMERGLGLCPEASYAGGDVGDAVSPLLIPCNWKYGPKFRNPVQGFEQGESSEDKAMDKSSNETAEMDGKLSLAMEEIKSLQSRLSKMERYTSLLHGSIFRKPFDEQDIPSSLQDSGTLDIAKEWDDMLESADRSKLVRMEMFYRNMLAGVKDKLMKRRIKEIVQECLQAPGPGK
ncbi:hypothetical protein EUGRSUZ_C00552 [Eucalyptus grandis]|uniref:Uncharacterized protein n=1 Tax=Eucalyptus grandis TaxID=71139 RepID=A0ACC3L9X6_EUCGR|nr:hypothetical protein EUGRSUZ_C00552 [Eucalyptus grandis]